MLPCRRRKTPRERGSYRGMACCREAEQREDTGRDGLGRPTKGLDQNTAQLLTLFGLANLAQARRWLLAADGEVAS